MKKANEYIANCYLFYLIMNIDYIISFPWCFSVVELDEQPNEKNNYKKQTYGFIHISYGF